MMVNTRKSNKQQKDRKRNLRENSKGRKKLNDGRTIREPQHLDQSKRVL